MPTTRYTGQSVSIFTLGGADYSGDLENATVTITTKDEDAAGIKEQWEYAWGVKQSWQIEADSFLGSTDATALAGTSVAVAFKPNTRTFSGQVLVTQATVTFNRDSLQKGRFVLKGQGSLTISSAS